MLVPGVLAVKRQVFAFHTQQMFATNAERGARGEGPIFNFPNASVLDRLKSGRKQTMIQDIKSGGVFSSPCSGFLKAGMGAVVPGKVVHKKIWRLVSPV